MKRLWFSFVNKLHFRKYRFCESISVTSSDDCDATFSRKEKAGETKKLPRREVSALFFLLGEIRFYHEPVGQKNPLPLCLLFFDNIITSLLKKPRAVTDAWVVNTAAATPASSPSQIAVATPFR